MGRLFSDGNRERAGCPPGALAGFKCEVLMELWLYLARKHGCAPSGALTGAAHLAALFDHMRAHGLGWRDFWDAFPFELREQGSCSLDDDTVDALGLLLRPRANKRRFERHFDELAGGGCGMVSTAAASQALTAVAAAPAATGTAPVGAAGAGAVQRRRLVALRTAGGRVAAPPAPELLAPGACPVALFSWLCSDAGCDEQEQAGREGGAGQERSDSALEPHEDGEQRPARSAAGGAADAPSDGLPRGQQEAQDQESLWRRQRVHDPLPLPQQQQEQQHGLEDEKGPGQADLRDVVERDQQAHHAQQALEQQQHAREQPALRQQQQQQEASQQVEHGQQQQGGADEAFVGPQPPFGRRRQRRSDHGEPPAGGGSDGGDGPQFSSGSGSDHEGYDDGCDDWSDGTDGYGSDGYDQSVAELTGGGDSGGGGAAGGGARGVRPRRRGAPAPFAAVHEALTADDSSLLEAVLGVVPYSPALRDTAAAAEELRALAAHHPPPAEAIEAIAADADAPLAGPSGVAAGAAAAAVPGAVRVLLLRAGSGAVLRSAAAAVTLLLAGVPWRREHEDPGTERGTRPPPPPAALSHTPPRLSAAASCAAVAAGAYLVDMSGAWDESEMEARLVAGLMGLDGDAAEDAVEMLCGHLKLLGYTSPERLVILMADCDVAMAVEAGAALFDLLRRLVTLLPRVTVVVASSADAAPLVADCLELLPAAGGAAEANSHPLPGGGGRMHTQLLRLLPPGCGGARGGAAAAVFY